jgi:hypothetical protein
VGEARLERPAAHGVTELCGSEAGESEFGHTRAIPDLG